MYDLVIRNGTVLDPVQGTSEVRDLYIKDGRFAEPGCHGQAARELQADGCYVAPGFIDAHIHVNSGSSQLGIRADIICPPGGVTTAIDPGSAGIYNFRGFYEQEIVSSYTTIKATISPTKSGVQMAPHEEIVDPIFGTPERLRPFFERYGNTLVGIKQRINWEVTREYGLKSLEQSARTARSLREEGFRCHLMIHFGDLGETCTLAQALDLLEPGDVFTHIYRPAIGTTIFDEDGRVAECVKKARARGVIFESGCARSHCSFESIRKGFADGFRPDIISTDIVNYTAFYAPSGWLPLKMAIYLEAGMSLEDVVKAVTYTPARTWEILDEAGTLECGRPADVTIFRLEERHRRLEDLYGGSMELSRLLVPMATIKRGGVVFQQLTF